MMTRTKWIRWAPDWHNREVASLSSCLGNNRYVSACFSFFFSLFFIVSPPFQRSIFIFLDFGYRRRCPAVCTRRRRRDGHLPPLSSSFFQIVNRWASCLGWAFTCWLWISGSVLLGCRCIVHLKKKTAEATSTGWGYREGEKWCWPAVYHQQRIGWCIDESCIEWEKRRKKERVSLYWLLCLRLSFFFINASIETPRGSLGREEQNSFVEMTFFRSRVIVTNRLESGRADDSGRETYTFLAFS